MSMIQAVPRFVLHVVHNTNVKLRCNMLLKLLSLPTKVIGETRFETLMNILNKSCYNALSGHLDLIFTAFHKCSPPIYLKEYVRIEGHYQHWFCKFIRAILYIFQTSNTHNCLVPTLGKRWNTEVSYDLRRFTLHLKKKNLLI